MIDLKHNHCYNENVETKTVATNISYRPMCLAHKTREPSVWADGSLLLIFRLTMLFCGAIVAGVKAKTSFMGKTIQASLSFFVLYSHVYSKEMEGRTCGLHLRNRKN